ncbi:MAG: YihY/virulence factor BrkB family protein [Bacteroidales bacterium]|nr:YihY/virulence factor BrkB family protein [Bacteroidales bacterium]
MVRIRLIKYKVVRDFIRFTKKIILPGFDGMPLWDVAVFFFQGVTKGSVTSRASSIAFSFFLAVFPMIIVFFTLIPFIPISGFHDQLMEIIMNVTPDSAEVIIIQTVEDIINRPRGGLLSVTFVMALIFATNGFDSVIEAFNNTYHTMESRSWIKQKLVSILLFFIISLIVIICITLIIGGTFVLKFLVDNNLIGSGIEYYLLEIVKYIVLASMFFFTISFIYYLAPTRDSKFRFISAGSSLATFLALAASIGFNFYIQNFSSYNALYGSIGTLLIILVWIYFNSIILLIGFELNASIQSARKNK